MRKRTARSSRSCMNGAIPRPSAAIVVTLEPACHAGGRGFESRRSRLAFSLLRPRFPPEHRPPLSRFGSWRGLETHCRFCYRGGARLRHGEIVPRRAKRPSKKPHSSTRPPQRSLTRRHVTAGLRRTTSENARSREQPRTLGRRSDTSGSLRTRLKTRRVRTLASRKTL
jgi:hypothetical protein